MENKFDLSLFANDAIVIGNGQQIEIGKEVIEEGCETLKSRQVYLRKSILSFGTQKVAIQEC